MLSKLKNNSRIVVSIIFTLITVLTSFSGCISDGGVEGDNDSSPNSSNSDGVLTILTYDILALSDEMVADFTNQSGIQVEFIRANDAGGVLESALLNKDSPQYDLIIGIDNSFLGSALAYDLFIPHGVSLSGISQKALSPYNGELAVPYDMGSICVNYDTSYVDGENVTIPTSLWNFTEEDWTGKVAVQNPRTSSPGRSFLIATTDYFANDVNDSSDYTDWWSEMNDNEVIVSSGWTESYETHYSGGYGPWTAGYIGDAQAVVSYCHSPGVEAWYGDNWTQSAALDISGASFFQVEYAAIPTNSGDFAYAKEFIEYLLSPQINSQMPSQNLMYSVLEGQDLPEENGYRHHSLIPTDVAITPSYIDAHIDEWLNAWDAALI